MQSNLSKCISANFVSVSDRFLIQCSIEENGQSRNINSIASNLIQTSPFEIPNAKLWLSEREPFRKIPYMVEYVETDSHAVIMTNVTQSIEWVLEKALREDILDLHSLCSYKFGQIPAISCVNDLRLELMTKNFQPHLVIFYPIMEVHNENTFLFGYPPSYWMFDPLIDALSYRRSGQKATLIFLILHSDVDEIGLVPQPAGDTIKLLKESMKSGMNVLTPKINLHKDGSSSISLQDRLVLDM
ncbi:MAG: hypothetical protein FJ161_01560 [Gammaproteobacteria bacterium]|nr:hypothetical protein [Gammaproteobacteria bacterium]